MDSRALAAFLPSLISQLLILLLSFPSSYPLSLSDFDSTSNPNSNSNSNSNSTLFGNLLPFILHFLSTSEIAASVSLLSVSRKRKRTLKLDPDTSDEDEDPGSEIALVNSGIARNPDPFNLTFKMTSSSFEWLSGLLEPLLECRDPIGSSLNLPAETRLGVGLFRLSTGADYADISRRFGVSIPIANFCVKQLCRVLCTNFRFWVGFPNSDELESVSAAFETLTGFPNCCGFIDCARFEVEDDSIAAQIVVDSSSRILSIFAGFRGYRENSEILKSSTLYSDIEEARLLNSSKINLNDTDIPQYLFGDSRYPLLPWLLTPFVDAIPGSEEESFNGAHHLMRLSALRTIASLRNWGVLNRPIEGEFRTAVACIGACSILHNMLLTREDYSALAGEFGDQGSQYSGYTNLEENSFDMNASAIRSALATRAREHQNSCHPTESTSAAQL